MEDKRKIIKVKLPDSVKTFEEEQEYLMREFGIDRFYTSDDLPPDEDCEEIYEIEVERDEKIIFFCRGFNRLGSEKNGYDENADSNRRRARKSRRDL